ncbi:hypothetical protein GCM10010499_18120 [Streptomyces thermoviolaceus subsp. apingens]|nr:hypothetical protein GCM10010499_18120 [Streptomyces thermoviolaceus subsp. apingens]
MTERMMALRSRPAPALVLLAVSFTALVLLFVLADVKMPDAFVYRAEGAAVAHGRDLYGFEVTEGRLPATYPPFAALLFLPTAHLPAPALKALFLLGNAVLLAWLVQLSARLAGHRLAWTGPGLPLLCTATALALWLEPVFQTFAYGQINLALACLVLWDLTRPEGARGRGAAIGVAAGIKLTPGLFAVYLLLRGRRREAATALAAFAATVALGALVLPAATVTYWTRLVVDTDRVGKGWIVDNQALQGLVARALHTPAPGAAWLLPAVVLGAAGLWLASRTDRREPWGVLLTGLTALLVSPISWSHHWVWCVPLIAVLLADGHRTGAALVALCFTARTMWLVPRDGDLDLHLAWWQQPLAGPYALLACGVLVVAGLNRPATRTPPRRRSLSSPPAVRPRP